MLRAKKSIEMKCGECAVEFLQYPSQVRNLDRVFCSKSCWYSWKKKNLVIWNKGKTISTDSRLKYERPTAIKKGQHLSPATERKVGDCAGEKNNFWKGGITPINTRIRQSAEYKSWRKQVFERDDYTCQMCFERGVKVHADHIKPFSTHKELRFELSNGRTLCVPCHKSTPSYLKRIDIIPLYVTPLT